MLVELGSELLEVESHVARHRAIEAKSDDGSRV